MSQIRKHYKKLLKIMEERNIRYRRREDDEFHAELDYNPKRITIYSPKKHITYIDIYYILHELGHDIDSKKYPYRNEGAWDFMYLRYDRSTREWIERDSLPIWAKKSILHTERRAWNEAKKLAISLGIPVKKRFTDILKKSIKTYRDIPEY